MRCLFVTILELLEWRPSALFHSKGDDEIRRDKEATGRRKRVDRWILRRVLVAWATPFLFFKKARTQQMDHTSLSSSLGRKDCIIIIPSVNAGGRGFTFHPYGNDHLNLVDR